MNAMLLIGVSVLSGLLGALLMEKSCFKRLLHILTQIEDSLQWRIDAGNDVPKMNWVAGANSVIKRLRYWEKHR
jgi:hypothetical protein